MNYEKIGEFIAEKRKEKKLTQNELAEKLGVTDKAVSKWERGLGCPDVSILEVLAAELDISILELLKGRKIENEVINVAEADDYIKNTINTSKELFNKKIQNIISIILLAIVVFVSGVVILANINNYLNLTEKTYLSNYNVKEYSNKVLDKLDNISSNINELEKLKDKIDPQDYKDLMFRLKTYHEQMSKLKILNYSKDTITYNDMFMLYIEDSALSTNHAINLYNIMEKYFKNNKEGYQLLDNMLIQLSMKIPNSFLSDYHRLTSDTVSITRHHDDVGYHYFHILYMYTRQTEYVDYILEQFIKEVRTYE